MHDATSGLYPVFTQVVFLSVNAMVVLFFIYAFLRSSLNKGCPGICGARNRFLKVNMGAQGAEIDVSKLTNSERNFTNIIISEVIDLINDTEDKMTFKKIGLILRASIAFELRHEHELLDQARKARAARRSTLAKSRDALQRLRHQLAQAFARKKIAAGRGSFTVPNPVEGDVTAEGLHNSFLQISPFVAS